MSETNFSAMGEFVAEAKKLLDSIKGGAIRAMQTQFDQLKAQFTASTDAMIADVDSRGRSKLAQLDSELAKVRQSVNISAINGEPRYVTEITVSGDKDTFYPVYFRFPDEDETEIEIFRNYRWNSVGSGAHESDFNASHVAGVLIKIVGQAAPWSANANYLRTIVNKQTYRQVVANIGFAGYCSAIKADAAGADSVYNHKGTDYGHMQKSSFMLRGGKLTYQIISNKAIDFRLYSEGEEIDTNTEDKVNVKWLAKTLNISEIEVGDSDNNVGTAYIGYATGSAE